MQVQGRRDLRSQLIFTIDGEDAKDLDDAVSIEKTEQGYIPVSYTHLDVYKRQDPISTVKQVLLPSAPNASMKRPMK